MEIFSGRSNRSTKKWIDESNIEAIQKSLLEPLNMNPIITANIKKSKNYEFVLNRNVILHGRDINYANEINGLKAISFLYYISTIVYKIKKNTSNNKKI